MTNRKEDSSSVVALDGRIVFHEESNALRQHLKCLVTAGRKNIFLDMKDVHYIDGSGLGTLVAAHMDAKSQGASLRLCRPGEKFRKLLEITKLATVFQVCDPDAAAVASVSGICEEPTCPISALT
jgi:anti-sigma B factor antagonist